MAKPLPPLLHVCSNLVALLMVCAFAAPQVFDEALREGLAFGVLGGLDVVFRVKRHRVCPRVDRCAHKNMILRMPGVNSRDAEYSTQTAVFGAAWECPRPTGTLTLLARTLAQWRMRSQRLS